MTLSDMNIMTDLQDLGDYHYLSDEEEVDFIDKVKNHLDTLKSKPSQSIWNLAWQDVYEAGEKSPTYLNNSNMCLDGKQVCRWNQRYITTENPLLEKQYHETILVNITKKYFTNLDCVVEFGCGTGHNLKTIQNLLPDIKVAGSDFTNSSLTILDSIGIEGFFFDMIKDSFDKIPEGLRTSSNIGVLTMGSMEQIGDEWNNFFNVISELQPTVCAHVEPLVELYDEKNPIDDLAIQYHHGRGYLKGFLPFLQDNNLIHLCERTTFGNCFNEGYMVVIWKP